MNESPKAKEVSTNNVKMTNNGTVVTECVILEVKSNASEPSYADIEIKNDGNILGRTRLMLFA